MWAANWKLLENFTWNTTFAYWQPGTWWSYAYPNTAHIYRVNRGRRHLRSHKQSQRHLWRWPSDRPLDGGRDNYAIQLLIHSHFGGRARRRSA